MQGVGAAAASVGATVSGGDLSSGPAWSIAVTVIGETSRPVTRAGARPGDALWVTGALGGSRAALEAWRRGGEPQAEARRRYAHPEPRITAGRWLAQHGARAMLDLSDGLGGDAAHLAAASGVAVDIDLALLPLADGVSQEANRLGQSPMRFAAEGGEDFELLVALPPDFDAAAEFARVSGHSRDPNRHHKGRERRSILPRGSGRRAARVRPLRLRIVVDPARFGRRRVTR